MAESGVNILIGNFGEIPERKGTTILLGSANGMDANVIQLNKSRLNPVSQYCCVETLPATLKQF